MIDIPKLERQPDIALDIPEHELPSEYRELAEAAMAVAKVTTETLDQGGKPGDSGAALTPANRAQRVAICVCTCRRPKMLARCLRSLASQPLPSSVTAFIIVIDNDPAGSAKAAIRAAMTYSPLIVHARHEPHRGMAIARNAALDEAMRLKADWIAFIDDDEIAGPDWIAALTAPEYLDVPILLGAVLTEYPKPAPFWATDKQQAGGVKGKEGEACKTGTTGNVRLSAALVHAGLRFDEGLGFMGGEDNELFIRAHLAGFEIRRTLRAVVIEPAHLERLTAQGTHRAGEPDFGRGRTGGQPSIPRHGAGRLQAAGPGRREEDRQGSRARGRHVRHHAATLPGDRWALTTIKRFSPRCPTTPTKTIGATITPDSEDRRPTIAGGQLRRSEFKN